MAERPQLGVEPNVVFSGEGEGKKREGFKGVPRTHRVVGNDQAM